MSTVNQQVTTVTDPINGYSLPMPETYHLQDQLPASYLEEARPAHTVNVFDPNKPQNASGVAYNTMNKTVVGGGGNFAEPYRQGTKITMKEDTVFDKILNKMFYEFKLHFRFAQTAMAVLGFICIMVFGTSHPSAGFYLFVDLVSIFITVSIIGMVVAQRKYPNLQQKVSRLNNTMIYLAAGFDVFWCFFWMCAFAATTGLVNFYRGNNMCPVVDIMSTYKNCDALSSAAAFAFFNWFLFIVTALLNVRYLLAIKYDGKVPALSMIPA